MFSPREAVAWKPMQESHACSTFLGSATHLAVVAAVATGAKFNK